jgi:hypothetical protein
MAVISLLWKQRTLLRDWYQAMAIAIPVPISLISRINPENTRMSLAANHHRNPKEFTNRSKMPVFPKNTNT